MSIIDRIESLKKVNLLINPASGKFPPTAYLGDEQMEEVRALVKLEALVLDSNLVGEPMILGMNLVEVKQKDYLRVA